MMPPYPARGAGMAASRVLGCPLPVPRAQAATLPRRLFSEHHSGETSLLRRAFYLWPQPRGGHAMRFGYHQKPVRGRHPHIRKVGSKRGRSNRRFQDVHKITNARVVSFFFFGCASSIFFFFGCNFLRVGGCNFLHVARRKLRVARIARCSFLHVALQHKVVPIATSPTWASDVVLNADVADGLKPGKRRLNGATRTSDKFGQRANRRPAVAFGLAPRVGEVKGQQRH